MTAQEMFAELGYGVAKKDVEILAYSDENYTVLFYFFNKTYSFFKSDNYTSHWVHVVVHNAITQQMKELGWIE